MNIYVVTPKLSFDVIEVAPDGAIDGKDGEWNLVGNRLVIYEGGHPERGDRDESHELPALLEDGTLVATEQWVADLAAAFGSEVRRAERARIARRLTEE